MKYLSILLVQTDTELAGAILDMEEALRVGNNEPLFIASNGLQVKSFQYPEVTQHTIYLRGCFTAMDKKFFSIAPWAMSVEELKSKMLLAITEFLESKFDCKIIISSIKGFTGEYIIDFCPFSGFSPLYTKE